LKIKSKLKSRNFEKLQRFSAFSTKYEKIRENFIKVSGNRDENSNLKKIANFLAFLILKTPKLLTKFC